MKKTDFWKIFTKIFVIFILNVIPYNTFSFESNDRMEISKQRLLEPSVSLEVSAANLEIEEEIVLTFQFPPVYFNLQRTYDWKSANPKMDAITVNEEYIATGSADYQPKSTLNLLTSTIGKFKSASEVTVNETYKDDGIIKVLTVGNSFSVDAVENYLYDLAEAEGIPIMIGNLNKGGADLELHRSNACSNAPAYRYTKIDLEGNKSTRSGITFQSAIVEEEWDYISFQQVSYKSGQFETFVTSLPALINYAKQLATHPDLKILLHQTWAYAQNSTHPGFANYKNDQEVMYNSLIEAIRRAQELTDIFYVVPSGTAIQNARTSLIGDNLTRDGYHLDLTIGRYIAASTWFEALTGEHVEGSTYKPEDLTDFEAELAQYAAHYAIIQPDEVTEMVNYQSANKSKH